MHVAWTPLSLTAARDPVMEQTLRAGARLGVRIQTDPAVAGSGCLASLEVRETDTGALLLSVSRRVGARGIATLSLRAPRTPQITITAAACARAPRRFEIPQIDRQQLRARVLRPQP